MGKRIVRARKIGEMVPYSRTVGEFARQQTGTRLTESPTVRKKVDWERRTELTVKERKAIDLLFPRKVIEENAERRKLGKPTPLQVYAHGKKITEVARELGLTIKEVSDLRESAFKKMEVKKND